MRIMIDLPDELHAWVRGGKQGTAPFAVDKIGQIVASRIIERGVEDPMNCSTCAHGTPYEITELWDAEAETLAPCSILKIRCVQGEIRDLDFACTEWEARK